MVVDVAERAEDLARVRNGSDWSTFRVPEQTADEETNAADCYISCDLFGFRDLLGRLVVLAFNICLPFSVAAAA